jgi:hypothetical protein
MWSPNGPPHLSKVSGIGTHVDVRSEFPVGRLHGIPELVLNLPGGISMADAQSIQNSNDGTDASGRPLPWRLVHMLRDAEIGDLSTTTSGDAESPNSSASLYDQVATLTKILSRRYKGHDVFDMLALIGDHLGVL